MKRLFIGLLATTLSVAGLSHSVAAQTPAINSFSPVTISIGDGPWTLGWDFTPTTNITVGSLGFFDDNADGLIDSHDVGIWDAGTQVLITSTTVTNADGLIGTFRYHGISPVVLTAGTTYSIGATINAGFATDPYAYNSTFGVSNIAFFGPNFVSGAGLAYPVNKFGVSSNAYFGPNFTIGVSDVPEPGTVATGIILFGGVGLGILRGRRSHKS